MTKNISYESKFLIYPYLKEGIAILGSFSAQNDEGINHGFLDCILE